MAQPPDLGDKKYVLPSLLPEFAGKVNLIYIDPPFATGADFSFTTTIPESDESFTKEPSMIEVKAYRDTWGPDTTKLDSYLQWFYETVVLLRDLLAEDGSIYVHCDWRVSSAVRVIMDEFLGEDHFRNELVWRRGNINTNTASNQFPRNHDTIFFYRAPNTQYSRQLKPYSDATMKMYRYDDNDGRGSYRLQTPRTYSAESISAMEADNRIVMTSSGPNFKQYLSDKEGVVVDDVWDDIMSLQGNSAERLDYPTQKPEALLERIIKASSNEGDLVLDCFCGSGTTAAVAEKLGRRWITCDLGRFAIHTACKRLLSIANVKPFVVQNLGKYERQAWQMAEFGQGDTKQSPAAQLNYRRFMLDLYRAQPLEGYSWLHGVRDGRLVHVGSVDAPVAVGDVQQIVKEFWRVGKAPAPDPSPVRGRGEADSAGNDSSSHGPFPTREGGWGLGRTNGVDVLGWDFAFEINEVATQMAADANVQLRFKRVPREVLEKRAVEQGDIVFFELAALSVRVSQKAADSIEAGERANGKHVTITLTDFIMPPDDVPDDVSRAVKQWSQWIDYWAVDWDYKGDAFHNMAQTYRTRKDPQLQTSLAHSYDDPGEYTVVVKVIDILGNDTTKTLKVQVQ